MNFKKDIDKKIIRFIKNNILKNIKINDIQQFEGKKGAFTRIQVTFNGLQNETLTTYGQSCRQYSDPVYDMFGGHLAEYRARINVIGYWIRELTAVNNILKQYNNEEIQQLIIFHKGIIKQLKKGINRIYQLIDKLIKIYYPEQK